MTEKSALAEATIQYAKGEKALYARHATAASFRQARERAALTRRTYADALASEGFSVPFGLLDRV